MIPKEVPIKSEGDGRTFDMPEHQGPSKNDAERNAMHVINLGDLNGDPSGKDVPKNFHKKAGRTLVSFTKYWSPEEALSREEDEFDVE